MRLERRSLCRTRIRKYATRRTSCGVVLRTKIFDAVDFGTCKTMLSNREGYNNYQHNKNYIVLGFDEKYWEISKQIGKNFFSFQVVHDKKTCFFINRQ